jgi:hypothetical protein
MVLKGDTVRYIFLRDTSRPGNLKFGLFEARKSRKKLATRAEDPSYKFRARGESGFKRLRRTETELKLRRPRLNCSFCLRGSVWNRSLGELGFKKSSGESGSQKNQDILAYAEARKNITTWSLEEPGLN